MRSSPLLSLREREVAELASSGLTNKEIAAQLGLSPETIKNHLSHAFTKLGVHNRIELAREMVHREMIRASSTRVTILATSFDDGSWFVAIKEDETVSVVPFSKREEWEAFRQALEVLQPYLCAQLRIIER